MDPANYSLEYNLPNFENPVTISWWLKKSELNFKGYIFQNYNRKYYKI